MYTEANEAPLEERRLKLSMHYYLKTRACTDNPAHHALHEFDPMIRDLYLTRPNGRGGMTRPSTQLEKMLKPNSESIMMLKDHMMKSTLMDLILREGGGGSSHQPPVPEWWDDLPPNVQETPR